MARKDLCEWRKEATVGLDYILDTDYTWSDTITAYFQENLPANVFTQVSSCKAEAIDISPNVSSQYKNGMSSPITKELFSSTATSKLGFQAIETAWIDPNFTAPTKLHILWTVRGI